MPQFSAHYFYIAYRYDENSVRVLVPPGNVCTLSAAEFDARASGNPFLLFSGLAGVTLEAGNDIREPGSAALADVVGLLE